MNLRPVARLTESNAAPLRVSKVDTRDEQSMAKKPVSPPRGGTLKTGTRGPSPKPRLTPVEQAYYKCLRNQIGLTNKDLANSMGCSVSLIRGVLNGSRGLDEKEAGRLWTVVLPAQPIHERYKAYSPWTSKVPIGQALVTSDQAKENRMRNSKNTCGPSTQARTPLSTENTSGPRTQKHTHESTERRPPIIAVGNDAIRTESSKVNSAQHTRRTVDGTVLKAPPKSAAYTIRAVDTDAGPSGDARALLPNYFVFFDKLKLSGKARNPTTLTSFFDRLFLDSHWLNFELPPPLGPRSFYLQFSTENYFGTERRSHPHFRKVFNVGYPIIVNGSRYIELVGRLYVGATRGTCDEHKWVRGPHKRTGKWRAGCWFEEQGEECPSDHYERVPPRCGHCDYSADEYRKCPACTNLANRDGCPECDAKTALKQDIMIEITGAGCQLGFIEPLVQHLFTPWVRTETVTRDDYHIAMDIEAPPNALVPFQRIDGLAPGRGPFKAVRAVTNEPDVTPGIYFGSDNQVVIYDKPGQIAYRREVQEDETASVPAHMERWAPGVGLRIEFRSTEKSLPGEACDLSKARKHWMGMALADVRYAVPGTIEAELVLEAKRFGFAHRTPSRDRLKKRRAKFDLPRPLKSGREPWRERDITDVLVVRQERYRNSGEVEQITQVLADALYEELKRIQHPLDIGQAVEDALPALEASLRRALTPGPTRAGSELRAGVPIEKPPGIVTWEENARRRRLERQYEYEACENLP